MAASYSIYLSPPYLPEEAKKAVMEALDSGWIAPAGPHLTAFENAFAAYIGSGHALALSSGSAAIQLMYRVLNIQPGDVVIGPDLTYIATFSPLLELGAEIVLCDVDEQSYQMKPECVEKAIQQALSEDKHIAAIHLVHFIGMMKYYDEISTIALKYDIPIIEDCAESLGTTFKDRRIGAATRMASFSFNGNKILTTSGGGMLWCNTERDVQHAQLLSRHGNEEQGGYWHTQLGYNMRMSNIMAAMGLSQLPFLPEYVTRRRALFERYKAALSPLGTFQDEPNDTRSNRWLSCIRFPRKAEGFKAFMDTRGIEVRQLWRPMHHQPVLRDVAKYVGKGTSTALFETTWCLPSGYTLSEQEQESVIQAIKEFWSKKY